MKAWITKLLAFVLFALLFQQAILWGSRGVGAIGFPGLATMLTHPHAHHKFLQERTQEWAARIVAGHQPRVLFFGSSTVMNGVDPQLFDSLIFEAPTFELNDRPNASFSLASQGQSLREIPHLIEAALHDCAPEVIYIGLSPQAWGYVADQTPETVLNWSTQSTLWNSRHWRKAAWAMAWESGSPHSLVLALHGALWRDFDAPLPLPSPNLKNARYAGAGHVENLKQFKSFSPSERSPVAFPDGWCQRVESIEANCAKAGVEVVWLVMPTLTSAPFELPNCLAGRRVIRGDLWPGRGDSRHYADKIHMNPVGARAFTSWLATAGMVP